MDIDVKNAYSDAVKICEPSLRDVLTDDIYRFIKYISISGAEERFDTFCKIYIQKDLCNKVSDRSGYLPMTVEKLKYSDNKAATVLVSFFMTLGKHYIFSRFDKEYIDKDKYITYMKQISNIPMIKDLNSNQIQGKHDVGKGYLSPNDNPTDDVETEIIEKEPEESLEELIHKLHSMIGLDAVKDEVDQIINIIQMEKMGKKFGAHFEPISLHLVFFGNPGTGKTTVARLLGKIYKALGVLSKGQIVEVDRGGLVAGHVGQTAIKTKEKIDEARGGILFIDEAYTLTHGKGEGDFGQEAVDTILKAMEDYRDDFVVIVAGYPELMKGFINSNPGLKSRFNQYVKFEDYTPEQLKQIFMYECNKQNLVLEPECEVYIMNYFKILYDNRTKEYANGRDVRNFFETVNRMRANRLSVLCREKEITKEEFFTISISDVINAEKRSRRDL